MIFNLFQWVGGLGVATAGIVNAIANTRNAKKNRESQKKVETNRLAIQKASQEGNYALQRELFEKQRKLQLELLRGNRETQLMVVQEQRETARQQPWYQKRVDNWPLRLVPEDIISAHPNRQPMPLQIILAPPEIDYDRFGKGADFPKLEKRIAQKMRSLFDRHFPLDTNDRPVELLDRAWDSNRFGGGSSIRTLFNQLRSESVLLLESETTGETINLRVAYWSGGAEIYNYKTAIADLPYLEILDEFARQRVLKWKTQVYDKRIAQGKTEEELRQRYPQQMAGLNVWRTEQEDLADGIPFDRHYPYIAEDDARFCELFTSLHSLMAGVFADLHYLILENREPQLPAMLPEILPGFADAEVIRQMLELVVASYEQAFTALKSDRDAWLADLRLAFAEGLTHLPDQSWVHQQLERSMTLWLQQRGGEAIGNLSQLCDNVEAVAMREDQPYLKRVSRVLNKLGKRRQLTIPESQLQPQVELKSEVGVDYSQLQKLLSQGKWKEADKETARVMLKAANRESGWLDEESIEKFPCADLRTIDQLWVKYSDGRFGLSVQKRIYVECGAKLDGVYPGYEIWKNFCDRIGWRLNGEWMYTNQLTFSTSAPQGHLPASYGGIASRAWVSACISCRIPINTRDLETGFL